MQSVRLSTVFRNLIVWGILFFAFLLVSVSVFGSTNESLLKPFSWGHARVISYESPSSITLEHFSWDTTHERSISFSGVLAGISKGISATPRRIATVIPVGIFSSVLHPIATYQSVAPVGQIAGATSQRFEFNGQQFAQMALLIVVVLSVVFVVWKKLPQSIRQRLNKRQLLIIGGIGVVIVGIVFVIVPQFFSQQSPIRLPTLTKDKPTAQPTPTPEPWVTYSDPDDGFAISFPREWLINAKDGIDFTFIADATKSAQVKVGITAIQHEELKDSAVQQQVITQVQDDYNATAEYDITEVTQDTVAGYPAAHFKGTRVGEGVTWYYQEHLLFIPDGRLYRVAGNVAQDASDTLVQKVQKVIQSFDVLSEGAISARLDGKGSFVASDTCVLDLAGFDNVSVTQQSDSNQCGMSYTLPGDADSVSLQDWYRTSAHDAGWVMVENSVARLENNGKPVDTFALARCAAQGPVDQEAFVLVENGSVVVEAAAIAQDESYCALDIQRAHFTSTRDRIITEHGYTQPILLPQRFGHDSIVVNYPNDWEAKAIAGRDIRDPGVVSWLTNNDSIIQVFAKKQKSTQGLLGMLDDQVAADQLSVDSIQQSIESLGSDVVIQSILPGQVVQRRGVIAVYRVGDHRYTAFFTVFRRKLVAITVTSKESDWAEQQPVLIEMVRNVVFQ